MLPLVSSASKTAECPATQDQTHAYLRYGELRERLVPVSYPRGAHLYREGHPATGTFGVVTGAAKEYVTSPGGKTVLLRVLRSGDLLGLEAVIGGTAYVTSIKAIEPTTAYFLTRRDLLGSMRCNESFRVTVIQQLCERYRCAQSGMRRLRAAASVPARIAQFLLGWRHDYLPGKTAPCIRINLTHEEIGQAIGTTRETVTRIVSSFRRKGWIHVNGGQWRIEDRASLADLAAQL
jgi:CRP/FNR family cyclic AMP-dependent transcriptional regulator